MRICGADDVRPRPGDGDELAELREDAEGEPLPLDRRQVAEEDPDRVEDGVDHRLSVAIPVLEVSSAAAEVAAAEVHAAAEVGRSGPAAVAPPAEAAGHARPAPAAVAPAAERAAQQLAHEEA